MPRRIADWWASFSQGSDHPSSAFSCSESWRMTSRWWWAHCDHLAESRLFMKESEPGPGWECLAHHAVLLRKEQTCREQEFQGSRVFRSRVFSCAQGSTAKFCCLPEHSLPRQCVSMGVTPQTFPVLLQTCSSIQDTGYWVLGMRLLWLRNWVL